jgi:iron complex outermembrane receptor protein
VLFRRLIGLFVIVSMTSLGGWAASQGSIKGQVTDPSGAAIAGASVTATNTTSGIVTGTTTDSQGQYQFNNLVPGHYLVAITKIGFTNFTKEVPLQPGEQVTADAKLPVQAAVQSVQVQASAVPGATLQPSQLDLLQSNQTTRVIGRKEMDAVGPLAGAPAIISMAPGANVTGYGATGQTKATIAINGINQGWGGYGGYTYPGSLGVTLDGIPIVDAGSGLWPSASLPQTDMFQNTNVNYGPGDPATRFYTDVGGSIEFTPVQPTSKAHIDGIVSGGSFGQKNFEFNAFSGLYHGWSTVLSGGMGDGNDFRVGPDGFANPSKDGAVYAKSTKSFQTGIFSVGGYFARAGGYRAQVIPIQAVPGLTVDGLNAPGATVYSQQTSGFYSTLPYDSYNKYDINELGTVYAKEVFLLSSTTGVENDTWFSHEFREHKRLDDVYVTPNQEREYNNPHHNTVGDRLEVSEDLPYNKITEGGYFLHDIYNSRNNFYDPALGGDGPAQIVNIGGKVRSSYFIQDNYAGFVQDDFHPKKWLHITPGVRFDRYGTSYYSGTLQDFTFAPGVIATLTSHCAVTGTSFSPNVPVVTVDQGSDCGAKEFRNAVEPSINAAVQPREWLTFYGGYVETYRSPSLGGGGGIFQSLNPNTNYILASGQYSQAGFKVHFPSVGHVRNILFGAAYYHLRYANEQLSIELGNGNVINTAGSSSYNGVNAYIDLDPTARLHLFTNLNGEGATYTQFYSGNVSFANLPVPYVPTETWNTGAYYAFEFHDNTVFEPRFWYQFIGPQHIFDNCGLMNGVCTAAAPSHLSMPSYESANLSLVVPFKFLEFSANMLNLFDQRYNLYEYISAGGYYGTSTAGYTFAYPGAPFTIFGAVRFHF